MKYIKLFEQYNLINESEDLGIVSKIDAFLKEKGLEGAPATNENNPQDDIAKLKKDYVTFVFKNNKGIQEYSVYFKNTTDNLAIAKELLAMVEKLPAVDATLSTSFNQGRIIGITKIFK